MTGDFNTPSHLDWTAAADAVARRRALSGRVAGDRGAGAAPGSRTPTAPPTPTRSRRPGITWTFGYPFPRLRADEVGRPDRPGPGVAPASRCSTPGSPGRRARPTSRSRVDPVPVRPPRRWSRACASCRPRRAPFASVLRPPGGARRPDRRALRARRAASGRDRLAIVRARRRGPRARPDDAAAAGGRASTARVTFGSGGLRAGPLRRAAGRRRRPRGCRAARSGSSRPTRGRASACAGGHAPAAPIRVAWRNAPGATAATGWASGRRATPTSTTATSTFAYTGATVAGRDAGSPATRRTFPPGRYVARLHASDDGYGVLAQARFTVARR